MYVPTIIDIEASGLGRGSYPIEIGFITGKGRMGCTLIHPADNWSHWEPKAEKLHGISREILANKGRNIVWVAHWLNKKFKNSVVYSDGWVNDMCWLGNLFNEAEVLQTFKIESLLTLLTEQEKERWSLLHDTIVAETPLSRHRASSDAKMIQQTYFKLKNQQECFNHPYMGEM